MKELINQISELELKIYHLQDKLHELRKKGEHIYLIGASEHLGSARLSLVSAKEYIEEYKKSKQNNQL